MDKKIEVLRIGIFYDGHYFYKVSNYYKYVHERKSRINISGLHEFIRNEIAAFTEMELKKCQIIDAHYFRGRSLAKDMGEKAQSERSFEDILMRENIVSHYLPLRLSGEGSVGQEKGIDVWLALEAYELAIYKHFDILVLITGDGDYVPLVHKLHTLGAQVMLICWDLPGHGDNPGTRTSGQLLSKVFHSVQMQNKEDIDDLFVPEKPQEAYYSDMDDQGEYESIIFSIHPNGYGFIRDDKKNNLYFHSSDLTNPGIFPHLKSGMKVRCGVQKDEERSKLKETPCYKATNIVLIEE